ncbi:MAG: hypothetical protein H0X37_23955 [Herpetosiphonaceae bacterium]|nr:hypothetical protein [Herpetosiphonaceae bacterium]
MKILLFGDTTAIHALTWKLFDSPTVDHLLCAPGNGCKRASHCLQRVESDPCQW